MVLPAQTTLVTGISRSGTTLLCSLLNELPDTVALAEPIRFMPDDDHARVVRGIVGFVEETRERILATHEAPSRHVGGMVPDNWAEPPGTAGLRRRRDEHGLIRLDKPLSSRFSLIVKHHGEFIVLADRLAGHFPLFGVVRHPLAVLASWQTVDLPIYHGHLRSAEAFDPVLCGALAAEPDRIRRQVLLLGWMLRAFGRFPPDRILRYEDLTAAPQQALARFSANPRSPQRPLRSHEPRDRYPGIDLAALSRALEPLVPLAEVFYPDFARSLGQEREGMVA